MSKTHEEELQEFLDGMRNNPEAQFSDTESQVDMGSEPTVEIAGELEQEGEEQLELESDQDKDSQAEEDDSAEDHDDENQQDDLDDKRGKNRESRKERTERRRAAEAKLRAEHEAVKLQLDDIKEQNRLLAERVAIINQTTQQFQQKEQTTELQHLNAYESQLREEFKQAKASFDSTRELDIFDELYKVKARKDELARQTNTYSPHQQSTQYQAPQQPVDPRLQQAALKFNEFVTKQENGWLNQEFLNGIPQTMDAKVANDIYNGLIAQNYDPRSSAFYDVAQMELKRKLPHKYNATHGQKRNAPPVQSERQASKADVTSSKKFKITREEGEILKMAGITGTERQIKFIKEYRKQP